MMKRSISILLALVVVFSTLTFVRLPSSAAKIDLSETADAGDVTYNMYSAEYYKNSFNFNQNSMARIYYNELKNDTSFKATLSLWEANHVVASPSYALEMGEINMKDYYKTVLFDLLAQTDSSSGLDNFLTMATNKQFAYIVNGFKKVAKAVDLKPEEINKLSPETVATLTEKTNIFRTLEGASVCLKIADWAKDARETFEVFAKYQAIADLKDGTKYLLTQIANDTNNPDELRAAARDCVHYFGEGYEKVLNQLAGGAVNIAEFTFDIIADTALDWAWDMIASSIVTAGGTPVGAAILAGLKGGRMLANYIFKTDKEVEAYYKLKAAVAFEDSAKRLCNNLSDGNFSQSDADAYIFLESVKLYEKSVLLGFDYTSDMTEMAGNSSYNQMTDFLFGKYSECQALLKTIAEEKEKKEKIYKAFENKAMNNYKARYCPDYDSVLNGIAHQNIPLETIGLTQIKTLSVGDEGYIENYLSASYLPTSHTEVFYTTWMSSDESIIRFKKDYLGDQSGDFECLSEGICTITCTASSSGVSGSIEITVGQKPQVDEHDYLSDFVYKVNDDGITATITKYNGTQQRVIIPSVINGYLVAEIGLDAFSGTELPQNKMITSISIPNTVTYISARAFNNCSSLKSINIPNSVTRIEYGAFYNCSGLSSIAISNGISEIGSDAFADCTGLKSITIPDSVTEMGSEIFQGCTGLISARIGNGVAEIEEKSFEGCTRLRNISIGNSVTSIGSEAFSNCKSLTSITIPERVTYIGSDILFGCSSLSEISIPVSIPYNRKIGELFGNTEYDGSVKTVQENYSYYIYYLPKSLTTVKLSSNGEIQQDYFLNCSLIENIIIGDDITGIGYGAFTNCTSLKNITIGKNVRSVGATLSDCDAIEKLCFSGTIDQWAQIEFYGITYNPVYYTHNLYIQSKNYYEEKEIVFSDVPVINNYAFYGFENLERVTFAENTDEIGFCSFKDCTSLKTVTLSNKNIRISSEAFRNCTELQSILGDYCILSIGANTFLDCENLNEIRIGSTNETEPFGYIQSDSFRNCKNLKNVFIGNDIADIGEGAFSRCSNLTNITIGKNVKSIGYYQGGGYNTGNAVFYGCNNLKRVDYLGTIDDWAEIDFHGLSSPFVYGDSEIRMYIDDEPISEDNLVLTNATQINSGAFYNWKSISSITIPDSVTSIGSSAFAGCEGLTNITIPESVTSIGNTAFYWSGLNSIIIPSNVIEIGEFAFPRPLLILFLGSKEQWEAIDIGDGNYNFTLHYNCKYIDTTAPNCEDAGYDLYTCSECEGGVKINYTDSIGHDCSEIIVAPTCIERGYTLHKCTRCNYEYKDNYVDMIPHDFLHGICTMCGKTEVECYESTHPYENNTDKSWTIHKEGAKRIALTFSEDTKTESGYDYIYLYNSSDEQVGQYSGTELAGKRVIVTGDAVRIRLTSDSSNTYYGFSLTEIKAEYDDPTEVSTERITEIATEGITEIPSEESTEVPTEPPTEMATELPTEAMTDTLEDKVTNISVDVEGDDTKATLKVEELDETDVDTSSVGIFVAAFNITLLKNNVEIQPINKVKVRIPCDDPNAKVYRVEADGSLTDMNAVFENGYLVFTTNHFSVYIVAEDKKLLLGDVDSDGEVTIIDATCIQRNLASLPNESFNEAVADTDDDHDITVIDATYIQRWLAGLSSNENIGKPIG